MQLTQLALVAIMLLLQSYPSLAAENLDELAVRKSRLATAMWGKATLEDASTLVWQPETLAYTDTTTGNEVWRLSSTKQLKNSLPDISWAHWSADGKRFSFGSNRDTSANNSDWETDSNSTRQGAVMLMRADGSYLRPADNGPFEVYVNSRYLHWSPVEPDVYYGFGRNYASEGLGSDDLYRVTVGDTSISKSKILDLGLGAVLVSIKKAISGDGTRLLAESNYTYFPITINPSNGTATLDDADGWAMGRQLDNYWGNTPATASYTTHDEFIVGTGSNVKLYFIPEGKSSWWRYQLSGSAADGGPLHIVDNDSPYSWGEIEPVFTGSGSSGTCTDPLYRSPWNCSGWNSNETYLSHPGFDKWGRLVAGLNSQQGNWHGVWDLNSHTWSKRDIPVVGVGEPGWHDDWEAWSDYFSASPAGVGGSGIIYTHKYDGTDSIPVAHAHIRESGSTDYNSLPRATQSPDGTKIVFHSDFLYNTANAWDVFYAVAYYPHPPEITSVTNNSGTYTIRFDWRTDQSTSRGYTQRGWPDEATDDPPPPRETKLFRLWRSANGASGWEPVGTVDADIFNRYDFSTGDWTGSTYWEISDTPGSGAWYYAVTSQEWSGLESHTLSNVFSTAGSQTAAYPDDPKGDAEFLTTYNSGIKRHYNIYAADGAAPDISQTDRIASIPVTSERSYVDWLGNSDGSTQYKVTAVDTQGNESTALSVSFEHTATPGQYNISWSDARVRYRLPGGSLAKPPPPETP